MTTRTLASRRPLAGSPFAAPTPTLSAYEHVKQGDLVTHDRLGVCTVSKVLNDEQVVVTFRDGRPATCVLHTKLTVL